MCGLMVLGPAGLLEKHSSGSAWKGRVSSCRLLDRDARALTPTSGTALALGTRVWHRPRQDHAVTVQMRDALRHLPTRPLWLSREGHHSAGEAHGGGPRTGRPPGPQEAPEELGVPDRTAAIVWLIGSLGSWTQRACPCRGLRAGSKAPVCRAGVWSGLPRCLPAHPTAPRPWARPSSGHPAWRTCTPTSTRSPPKPRARLRPGLLVSAWGQVGSAAGGSPAAANTPHTAQRWPSPPH